MQKLVSDLKSMGLEHYCGINRSPQGIRLFFPPPKYEWKRSWFWPFGKGYALEIQYENAKERSLAHSQVTGDAYAELAKLVETNYVGISTNLLMAVKTYDVGPGREKAAFIHIVALNPAGESLLEKLKEEFHKQGIKPVHPAVQENSAADDLNPGGWSN